MPGMITSFMPLKSMEDYLYRLRRENSRHRFYMRRLNNALLKLRAGCEHKDVRFEKRGRIVICNFCGKRGKVIQGRKLNPPAPAVAQPAAL